MSDVIAFIGGGNMAASLIGGLIAAQHPAGRIRVAEPDLARAQSLRERFGVSVLATAAPMLDGVDTLVLAVKPQQMAVALQGLQVAPGTCVVSIAAGIRLELLQGLLGPQAHYVRSMPNTPALYGAGISGLYASPQTPDSARARAETVLRAAGEICWLAREEDLDAVTAVSGSGPAYFFLVVEAMTDAGIALGLSAETAARLAKRTCIGAARMLDAGGADAADAAELRTQVTSKGGTTEAALRQLESAGLRPMFQAALAAAAQRSAQLGDEIAHNAAPPPSN